MATTNREIIAFECALRGIAEPVKTLPQWNAIGYRVKKGQKALFVAKIWKPCKQKKIIDDETGEEVKRPKKLILVNAGFFGLSQVAQEG